VIIDFCGPWEVFQDAGNFDLYTVAETTKTIRASGGMQIVPDYNFQNAPMPKVVVIPAQSGNKAALQWIRKSAQNADVVMSVCTGALLLATTGLLSGKNATTHHSSYRTLQMTFPDINIIRGVRYVEDGKFATSGGLSCGIDLALRVVERYYGREVASNTAYQMEYQGQGWMNPASNEVYAKRPVAAEGKALCPVCEMQVDPASAPKWAYKGKTYYFCSEGHKQQFQTTPQKFLDATAK
jgi:Transcriptional regulator containing an amidase domain and an AraC-type DNA-binding HTH domain